MERSQRLSRTLAMTNMIRFIPAALPYRTSLPK
jgi:hypothetical protein